MKIIVHFDGYTMMMLSTWDWSLQPGQHGSAGKIRTLTLLMLFYMYVFAVNWDSLKNLDLDTPTM